MNITANSFAPVLEVTRGETIESVHYGAIAVVDPQGKLVKAYGDPHAVTFLRSAAKPFQALPFIEAVGHRHYDLTEEEIAVICASHSGTDAHVAVVARIQQKAGLEEGQLMCGAHMPYHQPTADAMFLRGEQPTANRHNCSGKHTGMLAFAKMNGEPLTNYLEIEHPLQQRILQALADLSAAPRNEIYLGTDGCSAPNFALSLYHAAWAWARLADPSGLPEQRADACRTITAAMTAYPEMVSGPGEFDTVVMEAGKGALLVKAGAEGYQGIGILPGAIAPGSPALGVAIKIADGDGFRRARSSVSLETLRQLGALTDADLSAAKKFGPVKPVLNWRKLEVGEMRPVFELN